MRRVVLLPALVLCPTVAILQACTAGTGGTGPVLDATIDGIAQSDAQDAREDGDAGSEAIGDVVADADAASRLDTGSLGVPDSAVDVLAQDARADASDGGAPCDGVLCNGQCLAATDCRACAGAPLLCAPQGQCVSTCMSCNATGDAALPLECFACDQNHQNPLGTCGPNDTGAYCLNGSDFGQYLDGSTGYYCACSDAGANSCPGREQVCTTLG